jgi:hypothetical protein
MNARAFAGAGAIAVVALFLTSLGFSQAQAPSQVPPSPEWFVLPPGGAGGPGGFPGGGGGGRGRGALEACTEDTAKLCPGLTAGVARACLQANSTAISSGCKAQLDTTPMESGDTPLCYRSPICGNRITGVGSGLKGRVEWKPTLAYTPTYPFKDLPPGGGGVVAVAVDSKDNLWALQRNQAGKPQLFKFSPDHKLLFSIGDDVITHHVKAHGIKVDSQDSVWICDEAAGTIRKISPDGKLLLTLGERGHRGDWDEAKGQRLLWEPVMIDFMPNGDIFIFEGHANESPNDVDGPDPTNRIGAARVIHLDKNQKFINQWYGDSGGPGKFDGAHGSAVDPQTGTVWIGDREQYRIVQYTGDGKFIRTIQMRNLVCSLYFDPRGGLWMGSGLDGQLLKLDKDANVIGALGNGPGRGDGNWGESSYLTMDTKGNIYSGDTVLPRITEWVAPGK